MRLLSRTVLAAVLSVAGLAPALPAAAADGRHRPQPSVVIDPGSRIHGRTYGQWAARWWQYMFSIPVDRNPLTGHPCGIRQSGPVFFLGATYDDPQTVSRTCTVPRGRALFFPVFNIKNDNTPPLAGPGETQQGPGDASFEDLLKAARTEVDKAHDLAADLDDVPITGLSTTSRYRVSSPSFRVRPPADNLLLNDGEYAPAGKVIDPVVTDGVYLMLRPLRRGTHTLHFHAVYDQSTPLDVTFTLRVR
jgi:hypothetical protein